jgi:hypothetical protein
MHETKLRTLRHSRSVVRFVGRVHGVLDVSRAMTERHRTVRGGRSLGRARGVGERREGESSWSQSANIRRSEEGVGILEAVRPSSRDVRRHRSTRLAAKGSRERRSIASVPCTKGTNLTDDQRMRASRVGQTSRSLSKSKARPRS